MKFEIPCDYNLANIFVDYLENDKNIDFIVIDKPHFLQKEKPVYLVIECQDEKKLKTSLVKTHKKIFDCIKSLKTFF